MDGLTAKIRRDIELNGPMPVSDYMARCLADPEFGYYRTRDPFGRAGDFITAPEISQMFGELIGMWCLAVWQGMGEPAAFRLVELGPGRGTLMADLLRAAGIRPGFGAAASVHLVETSPALRAVQAETLANRSEPVSWHDRFEHVPDGPMLLVANEFLDALPIRQLVRSGGTWCERVVGLNEAGELTFQAGPAVMDKTRGGPSPPDGSVVELCPAAESLIGSLCQRIAASGGAALIVDYGYSHPGYGDTLQAVANHAYADPLANPGAADLTAHVNFFRLANLPRQAGISVFGPVGQGDFLLSLGLLERAGSLGAGKGTEEQAAITAAVERLAAPDQMGALFKALSICADGLSPPGFDRAQSNADDPA